jgi:hypothetical protein
MNFGGGTVAHTTSPPKQKPVMDKVPVTGKIQCTQNKQNDHGDWSTPWSKGIS